MTQKQYLLNVIRNTFAHSITLKIRNANMVNLEEIKFYAEDFDYKAEYIDWAYDDDLRLKGVSTIQIIAIEVNNVEVL